MRKIFHIFPMLILTIIAMHTNNLFAPYRSGKKYSKLPSKPAQPPKTTATRTAATTASTATTATTKTNAQKKQEVAALDKKIQQGTKQLADAVKQEKKAETPEEKAAAKKKVIAEAKKVLTFITEERNLQGELLGYSKEEIEGANAVLGELEAKRDALQKIVNDLKKQQKDLQIEGWKGWLWGSVKPGKETEFAKITGKLNKLEPELVKLNTAIRNQSIISGKQKFTKTRAFAGTALATALTAVALYTYLGPAGAKEAYKLFKENPREYVQNRASDFKNMVSGLLSSTGTQQAVLDASGNVLTEEAQKSILRTAAGRFGQEVADIVSDMFKMGKQMVLSAALSKGLAELLALINDEGSSKEEVQRKALALKKQQQIKQSQSKSTQ